jgi:hypothetical protein
VIRRAAQLARAEDAQLLVVHVQVTDGLTHPPGQDLDRHRKLTAELGGTIWGSVPVGSGSLELPVAWTGTSHLFGWSNGPVSRYLHVLWPAPEAGGVAVGGRMGGSGDCTVAELQVSEMSRRV